MRIICVLVIIFVIVISSCTTSKKQFKYSGESLRMALDNFPTTFITREISDYSSSTVATQIMEGLVSLDPKTLEPRPQLARSWKVSDDGLRYTFFIRPNVLFHAYGSLKTMQDRKMTIDDIIYTFESICSKKADGSASYAYHFLFEGVLSGAKEFFNGEEKHIRGISYTKNSLTLKLNSKDENFLSKLAHICASICSRKAFHKGIHRIPIGTGPFSFKKLRPGKSTCLVLQKNTDYYEVDSQGNALPYLDSLIFYFGKSKLEQLQMFESENTDLILGLPRSHISKMLEGRVDDFNSKPPVLSLCDYPLLSTQYYFFNMSDPRFKDPRIRQAFNYAIDREKLGRELLRNQYYKLGYYGIIPPIQSLFKGYDFKSIKEVCYTYNPVKAKKLLAEAGFPEGKGFGSVVLRINVDEKHMAIAKEFADQIQEVLNIPVSIQGSNFEIFEKDSQTAKGQIFRSAWFGDYVSPENFLLNFYGKFVPADSSERSIVNLSRYRNALFDHFIDAARKSSKKPEALENYAKAERILMQDPPVIPLWYSGDIQIYYSNVRNLQFNALNMFIFTAVYKKPWTVEEYTLSSQ